MRYFIFNSIVRGGHHAVMYWAMHNIASSPEIERHDRYSEYSENNHSVVFLQNTKKHFNPNQLTLFTNTENVEPTYPNYIVIRDYINQMCSIISHKVYKEHNDKIAYITRLTNLYIKYISYYEKNINKSILYNNWVIDKKYRDYIGKQVLEIPNINDVVNYVPVYGGGSSFIGNVKEHNNANYNLRYTQVKIEKRIYDFIARQKNIHDFNKSVFNIDTDFMLSKINLI